MALSTTTTHRFLIWIIEIDFDDDFKLSPACFCHLVRRLHHNCSRKKAKKANTVFLLHPNIKHWTNAGLEVAREIARRQQRSNRGCGYTRRIEDMLVTAKSYPNINLTYV